MNATREISLARRLMLSLAALVTATTLTAGGWSWWQADLEARAELQDKARQSTTYLEGALALPLWNVDDESVRRIGRTLMEDNAFLGLTVQDTDGRTVFSARRTGGAAHATRLSISQDGIPVGTASVEFSASDAATQGRRVLASVGGTFAAVLLVMSLGSVLLVRGFLKAPIALLTDVAMGYGSTTPPAKLAPRVNYVEFQPLLGVLSDLEGRVDSHVAQLRESEVRYRTLFEQADDAIFRMEGDRFAECNSKTLTMFDCRKEDIIGRSPVDFSPPVQPDGADSTVKAAEEIHAALSGSPGRFEWRHRRLDGTEFDAEVSLSRVDLGGARCLQAIVRDISDRKLAEKSLRLQVAFDELMTSVLRHFASCRSPEVDAAVDAALERTARFVGVDHAYVVTLDPDRTTYTVTHEWCAPGEPRRFADLQRVARGTLPWTGARLTAGEIVRINSPDDYPPEAVAERRMGRQSVLSVPIAGRSGFDGVVTVDSRDRRIVWSDSDVACLRMVGEAIANTLERKRAEEALQQEKTFTDAVLDAVPGLFYLFDDRERLVRWNKDTERLTGYSAGELSRMHILDWLTGDEVATARAALERAVTEGHAEAELGLLTRSRATVPFYLTAVSLTIDGRRYFTGVGIDISEQKRAQEEARRHQQSLIQADKMASLGLMVSGVAHEINNPNNLIMLNADVLATFWSQLRAAIGPDPGWARELKVGGLAYAQAAEQFEVLIRGIGGGAARIQQIVRNLKDFARVDSGELVEGVSIREVVDSSVALAAVLLRKATDRFELRHGEAIPPVRGSFQKLEQVVINLIANACQALPDRSRAVTIRTAFAPDRGMVVIEVHDEGIGIPRESLPRIFDPFFTTKKDAGGTGLGLSVSYGIVKEHGGEITFDSEVGRGTTASIWLPVGASRVRPA
jgi:PAS domain S-box-containing protein